MDRPVGSKPGHVSSVRKKFSAIMDQSGRTIMLSTVVLASLLSGVTGFLLTQYYSIDVLSSLLAFPHADCFQDWGMKLGRHCFSDYAMTVGFGMRANPWEPYPLFMPPHFQPALSIYPAAAMLPQMAFGLLGKWLGPQIGLLGYLLVLAIAVLIPAIWAARGARGLERVVVFAACGAVAIPAWTVIDRGNSVGFAVPIALAYLVALCRQRWGLVAIMVVLASLVKPQFIVLAVALIGARQWRLTGAAVVGGVLSNLAAYLLWPKYFPATIGQSIHNILSYNASVSGLGPGNVSFTRAILLIPDTLATLSNPDLQLPPGFLAGPRAVLGFVILALATASVVALGRRIPPFMAGIVLLATASLFPAESMRYYLVFALPIAAVVARDPDGPYGSGFLDRLTGDGRRRAVKVCVSLATALTIAQIALPLPFQAPLMGPSGGPGHVGMVGTTMMVWTTAILTPIFWLVTCAVIIVSYVRRPASPGAADGSPTSESSELFSSSPAS